MFKLKKIGSSLVTASLLASCLAFSIVGIGAMAGCDMGTYRERMDDTEAPVKPADREFKIDQD